MRLSSWRFIRFPCLRPQQQEQQSPRHASSQRRPSSKRFFRSSHQRPACEENLSMFKCCISSFGSTRSGFFGRADVTAGTSACTQCQMCQMGASAMPPTASRMTSECHTMKKCGRRRSNLLSCLSHLVPLHTSATTAAAKLFLGTRRHMKFMPRGVACLKQVSVEGDRRGLHQITASSRRLH